MKLIMDYDALIKLTKAGAKELIAKWFEISIPAKVYQETVIESEGFPDAKEIDKNVEAKKIQVLESSMDDKGEMAVLNLYRNEDFDFLVSDDKKFLKYLYAKGIRYLTPSSLIIHLFYRKVLLKDEAEKYIDDLKIYISEEEYLTAIQEVLRWEIRKP